MHSSNTTLINKAKTWVNSSLFNFDRAGDYFEYLVEGIDPMWSTTQCKARILEVIDETADTKTWVMSPNKRWKGFVAGQHVQITMSVNGALHTRTFTISSSPRQWQQDGRISITVKKVGDGRITPWMHENLKQGDIVVLSQAQGEFVLEPSLRESVAYIAAGSGITPIMSQLRWLNGRGMPIKADLLYFSNTQKDFIFGGELGAMAKSESNLTTHFIASYEKSKTKQALPQSPICKDHIEALLKSKPAVIYICGPHPFREIAKSLLAEAGFDLGNVREEAFGLPPIKVIAGDPVTINFSKSAVETSTDKPGTLLDMAEAAGLTPTAGCRMGICYTCKCKKKSGQVRNVITGEVSSADEEVIQICISAPVSNVEIEI